MTVDLREIREGEILQLRYNRRSRRIVVIGLKGDRVRWGILGEEDDREVRNVSRMKFEQIISRGRAFKTGETWDD